MDGKVPSEVRGSHSGLTLLETVIAIVIGLIVLAGTAGVIGKVVLDEQHTQRGLNEVGLLISAIHNLYSGETSTSGISAAVLANSGIAPKSMVNGSELYNPWGGLVYVTQWQTIGYYITYYSIPIKACIQLMEEAPSGVYEVRANGGTSYQNPTVTQASSACNNSTNNVEFFVESKDE